MSCIYIYFISQECRDIAYFGLLSVECEHSFNVIISFNFLVMSANVKDIVTLYCLTLHIN